MKLMTLADFEIHVSIRSWEGVALREFLVLPCFIYTICFKQKSFKEKEKAKISCCYFFVTFECPRTRFAPPDPHPAHTLIMSDTITLSTITTNWGDTSTLIAENDDVVEVWCWIAPDPAYASVLPDMPINPRWTLCCQDNATNTCTFFQDIDGKITATPSLSPDEPLPCAVYCIANVARGDFESGRVQEILEKVPIPDLREYNHAALAVDFLKALLDGAVVESDPVDIERTIARMIKAHVDFKRCDNYTYQEFISL